MMWRRTWEKDQEEEQTRHRQSLVHWIGDLEHIHEPEARPLHTNLRYTEQTGETLETTDLFATC